MRGLLLLVIGLVTGAGLGIVVAADRGLSLQGHDHGDPAQHAAGSGHDHHDHHAPRDLGAAAPDLRVEATRDPVSGWNLHLVTERFDFAPAAAGGAPVPGQGHAHLYVDGTKIARLYAPWAHLDRDAGEVRVVLTGNDHRPLQSGGRPVAVTLTLGG